MVDAYRHVSRYYNSDVCSVFTAVRDAVHLGARIISHPLSGSVKPNESPYKSVAMSTTMGELDLKSLRVIEDAMATLKKLPVMNKSFANAVLEDFQVIDFELISNVMKI